MDAVGFTRMEDGTRQDYELLERLERPYLAGQSEMTCPAVGGTPPSKTSR